MAGKEFFVDEDLCTGCGDCWTKLPKNFKDTGDDLAEVTSTDVQDQALLEEVMENCPGGAIQWK